MIFGEVDLELYLLKSLWLFLPKPRQGFLVLTVGLLSSRISFRCLQQSCLEFAKLSKKSRTTFIGHV